MRVNITGSCQEADLKIGDVDFGQLGPEDHKHIISEKAPHNYHQIPGWIVIGMGSEDCTLRLIGGTYSRVEVREVLDFQAMYSVHNFGYGEIFNRIRADVISYLESGFPAIPRAMDHIFHAGALEAITQFTGMDCVLMKSGGAEAVETACNIASRFRRMLNPKGGIFIAAKGNFHGRTRLARSLSDSPSSRDGFEPLLPNVHHVTFGNIFDLEASLTQFENHVIAVILEPIQGEGGVFVPPPNYILRAAELCKKHRTLLILDEIQTGFGRTGVDWVYERYGILPDLLCGGKAAGSGIVPVSFVAGKEDVMACLEPGTEGATWSATPIQCIAVTSAIRELGNYKLSSLSAQSGDFLFSLLSDVRGRHPELITDIRGEGLFMGVDTVFEGMLVSERLLEEGVWAKETGKSGKTIRFSPPLTVTRGQLREGVDAFERTLKKLEQAS